MISLTRVGFKTERCEEAGMVVITDQGRRDTLITYDVADPVRIIQSKPLLVFVPRARALLGPAALYDSHKA